MVPPRRGLGRGGRKAVTRGQISLAIVGCGYWGAKHVRVFAGMPDVSVTVVDTDPSRLAAMRRAYPSIRLAAALEDVLPLVDAVVVATPSANSRAPRVGRDSCGPSCLRREAACDDGRGMRGDGCRCGRARCVAHGRAHLRAQRRSVEAPRAGGERGTRRDPVRRLGATQPRAVPVGRQRDLGPRTP